MYSSSTVLYTSFNLKGAGTGVPPLYCPGGSFDRQDQDDSLLDALDEQSDGRVALVVSNWVIIEARLKQNMRIQCHEQKGGP